MTWVAPTPTFAPRVCGSGQEYDGSDSGARPDEAVSWGKIKLDASPVKVSVRAPSASRWLRPSLLLKYSHLSPRCIKLSLVHPDLLFVVSCKIFLGNQARIRRHHGPNETYILTCTVTLRSNINSSSSKLRPFLPHSFHRPPTRLNRAG